MSKYHNDQPIKGGYDDPDLLNRLDFSNHLANVLLLNHDDNGLTVSLEGEWGYGKTSVINLVKGALNEKETTPVVIEYNPWLAGNPESLVQDFLLQFSSQLHIKDGSKIALKAAEELIAYSSLFSAAKLIPGAEPWASIVEKVFSRLGTSTKKIAELKKLNLIGQKKKVVAAIKKIRTPIVVIIDDIDRLTPSETFQVLRLVKAVADFSGTSFLLAFDPNYLISVLNKNGIVNASEYINKVVQLRVPLPIISERGMNELAGIELDNLSDKNLTGRFADDQERLSWIYHQYFKHLLKNPRDLKRLFNHLRFVIEQVEGQVCFSDLFSLSMIATKAGSIYEHIKKTPEAYIGRTLSTDALTMDKPEEVIKLFDGEREKILEKFSESDRKLFNGLLGNIFPLLDSESYSPYGVSNADAAGRVSAVQRLHIALHYKTPLGYLSDQEILDFITGALDREAFLIRVLEEDTIERFLEMMMNYSGECKENSFDVLSVFYDVFLWSDALKSSLASNHGFSSNNLYLQMTWLTDKIIEESENQFELINELINNQQAAPLAAGILNTVRRQIHEKRHEEPWMSGEQLLELEKRFQETALKVLSNKMFVENFLETRIFYKLKQSSPEKLSAFISKTLQEENGAVRVAEIIAYSGRDSNNGPYTLVDDETLSDIIELDTLKEYARNINLSDHPDNIQAVFKSILDGKKYYLRDGTEATDW